MMTIDRLFRTHAACRTSARALVFPLVFPLAFLLAFLPVLACTAALSACTAKESGTVTPQVVPSELVVAPDGLDSNAGTLAAPLRSLARAAQLATPGTIVSVLPGTYQGGFRTATDGLPNARIVFRSVRRWGARIVPPPLSSSRMAWDNRASYVDIEGFDVDGVLQEGDAGTPWRIGIYSAGSHDRIAANHVHDVAVTVPCDAAGGAGIVIDSFYRGTDASVVGNSVHDIGQQGCRYVHGIYVDTPASVRDNVVYRVAEAGIHLWHDAHHVVVANNTIAASHSGIVVGGGDFYHSAGPNDHTQVVNNIVVDNRYGILEQGATGRHNSYRNNLVFQNDEGDWHLAEGMTHSGTVAAPPRFVDYRRDGTPDFRLAARSPAIGRGVALATNEPDFNGKARPRARAGAAGIGIDIGACQH